MPHSRWEEDSEEDEDKTCDAANHLQEIGVAGVDPLKRSDNAIFRRAISAIKPKVIEIKLRPERRVLLDSAALADKIGAADVDVDPEVLVNLRAALPLVVPKFNPALVDLKLNDIDEKKKSVRDRLGDKVESDLPNLFHADNNADDAKSKDKKDVTKKDKRSSPSKEKVCTHSRVLLLYLVNDK